MLAYKTKCASGSGQAAGGVAMRPELGFMSSVLNLPAKETGNLLSRDE